MQLMLDPAVMIRQPDQDAAFRWLDMWEMAVPLRPYTELALHHGDDEERALTKTLVRDLRQPVYDSRAVFVREGCPAVDALMAAWDEERAACRCKGFCGLPFLRALWRVKPLVLALPAGWVCERDG